jgi:hypothetical protein
MRFPEGLQLRPCSSLSTGSLVFCNTPSRLYTLKTREPNLEIHLEPIDATVIAHQIYLC